MKHKKTLLCSLLLISCLILVTSMPVFAAELTEAEVQQAVDAQGKETVTGNVFIWFLCAIAFLKVSQKIDSFMASLGVNVGNTGGNMMAELLIAGRGLASSFRGHGGGSHSSSHSSSPPLYLKYFNYILYLSFSFICSFLSTCMKFIFKALCQK